MKEDSFNKWLKSGLRTECEARKPHPSLLLNKVGVLLGVFWAIF